MSRALLLVAVALIGCASPSPVETAPIRLSPLGYAAVVPPGWVAVGRKELAGHEAEIEDELARSLDGVVDEDVLAAVKQRIRDGHIEFLLPEARPADSYDNVNVQISRGRVPSLGTDISSWCDSISKDLSEFLGRPGAVGECGLRRVGTKTAIVIESEGFYEGSVLTQYHLNHSPGKLLTITATLSASTSASSTPAVTAFVESVAFPAQ